LRSDRQRFVVDVLLAQKLALELFEEDAIGAANALPPRRCGVLWFARTIGV